MNETEREERTQSDPVRRALRNVCDDMKAEYGWKYSGQFKDEKELGLYKIRLFERTKEFLPDDIADGFELWVTDNPDKCPTIGELVQCIKQSEKNRKKRLAAELECQQKESASKANKIECNPIKMLAEAKVNADQANTIKPSMEERLRAHEALLTIHSKNIRKPQFDSDKKCAVSFCHKAGSLSSNTRGGGPFYCKEHYQNEG